MTLPNTYITELNPGDSIILITSTNRMIEGQVEKKAQRKYTRSAIIGKPIITRKQAIQLNGRWYCQEQTRDIYKQASTIVVEEPRERYVRHHLTRNFDKVTRYLYVDGRIVFTELERFRTKSRRVVKTTSQHLEATEGEMLLAIFEE